MHTQTLTLLAAAALTHALLADPAPLSEQATFALNRERAFGESAYPSGFLSGLRGFEHFYEPVGQPLYFESPFINTGVRFIYLHHEFSDRSQLAGGNVDVAAVQARVALTDRLALIATKDGYSWFDSGAIPDKNGWNSLAAGLKYAFIVDRPNDFVFTGGLRYMMGNTGEADVLQGGVHELSPFIAAAKGWDQFHLIGNITYRQSLSGGDGNNILQWDLHADYEVLPGLAPAVEVHGLHYLNDGTRTALSVGGLDYTNLGSNDVSGSTVVWAGVGGRYKLTPTFSIGATYEFALTNRNADIMDKRVTVDFQIVF